MSGAPALLAFEDFYALQATVEKKKHDFLPKFTELRFSTENETKHIKV